MEVQTNEQLEQSIDGHVVAAPDAVAVPAAFTLSDRFNYICELGSGGMGAIYKAMHPVLKKPVAIKMLHAHTTSDQHVRRFQQEAKAIAILDHPNIVRVQDFGVTWQGQPYMVMDFVEGTSLAKILEEHGDLPLAKCIEVFVRVCSGMQHAHEKGILHRDLKPSNVMISGFEGDHLQVKVVDFGIAKLIDEEELANKLTQTGEVFGSPLFMSPEQVGGKKLDRRSDIYSLGCLMYEALTGKPPLAGSTALETIMKQATEMPPTLAESAPHKCFPKNLEDTIATCLAKDPDDRYQSMAEVAVDLKGLSRKTKHWKERSEMRHLRKICALSAIVILLGIGFYLTIQPETSKDTDPTVVPANNNAPVPVSIDANTIKSTPPTSKTYAH